MTRPEIGSADPRDIALILALWHGGPACKDAALDLADANYRASRQPEVKPQRKVAAA